MALHKKIHFSAILFLVLATVIFVAFNFTSSAVTTRMSEASYNAEATDIPDELICFTKDFRPKMSITLDSNLIINVYIPTKNTVAFTFDGVLYSNLENFENVVSANGNTYYRLSEELPAAEAAKEISLAVNVNFDGTALTGRFIFSIPKYAQAVISSNATDGEKTLVKDALLYIASAYDYFGNEDAAEVDEAIASIVGSYKGKRAINSIDTRNSTDILSAAFVLDSKPGIKFYIDDTKDKNSYAFYVNNEKVENIREDIDDNGRYLLVSLYAYKMCSDIRYSVDGKEMGSYSIQNYYSYISKTEYNNENKAGLRNLMQKFYNYAMSAADYYIEHHRDNEIPDSVNVKDFTIVYPTEADELIIESSKNLSKSIEKQNGIVLPVTSDNSGLTDVNKIFVGNSSHITQDVFVKLSQSNTKDAFIIDLTNGNINIVGKTKKSTARAVEYFIENYVNRSHEGTIPFSEGATVIKKFIALENGTEIVVENISTVFGVTSGVYKDGLYPSKLSKSYYPSVIELKHNGTNNGKLIAILAVNDTPTKGYEHLDTNACVMESSDGGKTWKMIARPQETINPTFIAEDGTEYAIQGISMAHIYELPTQVGDMPAGTLLYSGTSVNYDCYSQVAIWRSFDCGYTWEEYTIVATGGASREGVWEPFTIYEESDGYLYCFYSDDSDPLHDQKLVFKRSKDGINWSEAVGVCVFSKQSARPGMIIMTRLGSGEYLMVYEYYGGNGGKIFYKITDDISSWNPTSPGTLLKTPDGYMIKGGPSCIWTPVGSEKGTLIVSGKIDMDGGQRHLLFVSFDYGRSWTTMENPLPYDITLDVKETNRVGHSASFIVGSDPSVIYYLNTTVNPENGYQRVEFAKLKIYE